MFTLICIVLLGNFAEAFSRICLGYSKKSSKILYHIHVSVSKDGEKHNTFHTNEPYIEVKCFNITESLTYI